MFINNNRDQINIIILIAIFIFISVPFHFLANKFYINRCQELESKIIDLESRLIHINILYSDLLGDYQLLKNKCSKVYFENLIDNNYKIILYD